MFKNLGKEKVQSEIQSSVPEKTPCNQQTSLISLTS